MSQTGSPYIQFALRFRSFLEEHGFTPSSFYRDCKLHMRESSPSASTVYMAFYGQRLLPLETILFMQQRFGFKLKWAEVMAIRINGIPKKTNQLELLKLREMNR